MTHFVEVLSSLVRWQPSLGQPRRVRKWTTFLYRQPYERYEHEKKWWISIDSARTWFLESDNQKLLRKFDLVPDITNGLVSYNQTWNHDTSHNGRDDCVDKWNILCFNLLQICVQSIPIEEGDTFNKDHERNSRFKALKSFVE